MAELRSHVEAFKAAGVALYVIGSGTPEQASSFATKVGVAGAIPILSDSKLVSYRAAGMKRSMVATLNPLGLFQYIRSFRNFKQGRTEGDPWQLGGAMIIKSSGEIAFSYIGQRGGDHPDPALLEDEARKATR